MENTNSSQLELFSQEGDTRDRSASVGFGGLFFSYMRSYEKVILLIIAFISVGIISFSLGVEKGKKIPGETGPVVNTQKVTPVKEKVLIQAQQPPILQKQNVLQGYTIQLASYQSKDLAQKEAELLKKKGLTPIVLPKGKYIVLCIGNFSNQEAAKSLLSELQKQGRYKGCFVRRL